MSPRIYELAELQETADGRVCTMHNGQWIPARPAGMHSLIVRTKAAWLVFTGKADAVTWPGGQ